jgi:hypothetical protein
MQATDGLMDWTVEDTETLHEPTAVLLTRVSLRTMMLALRHVVLVKRISRRGKEREFGGFDQGEDVNGTYRQMLLLVNLFFGLDAGMKTRDEEPKVYQCLKTRSSPISRNKGMKESWYT